jgi:rubrerythrin
VVDTRHMNPDDVVNLAVNIEEDGLAFYKALAEGATDPQAKAVFLRLATEEVQHVDDIREKIPTEGVEYLTYDDASLYDAYASHLFRTEIFPEKDRAKPHLDAVKGPIDAIELGRKAEMDSIRFYRAAEKACTHPGGKAAFEALIEEEEEHLRLLTELRDKLRSVLGED